MARGSTSTESTAEKRRILFLASLAQTPNVSRAADAAGIERTTAYKWRETDEHFAELWDAAIERSLDALEEALIARGKESDTTAAIFMLKSRRRAVFGDRIVQEHTGAMTFYLPERPAILPPDPNVDDSA